MELKDIYIKLNEINNVLESEAISQLLADLKKEIELQEATKKPGSRASRVKKCVSIIEKQKTPLNSIKKCIYIDGVQYMTNSYIAAALKPADYIEPLQVAKPEDNFPGLSKCFNQSGSYESVEIITSDIKAAVKMKSDKIEYNNNLFNPELIIELLYLLNIDNCKSFVLEVNDSPNSPAFIHTASGSVGVILPYRKQGA